MPFLIDGHNLIPKLGLDINAVDDEDELLARLNEYCRLSRKGNIEVYFDNAPPGAAESRKVGLVTAHFIRRPLIADEAIRQRLKKLGRAARNWSVVSSDRQVQAEARAAGATILSSEEFAATVIETLRAGPPPQAQTPRMNERELEEWMRLFSERGKGNG
ncbi:MAG: NYN domain-containing protein [Anaerolineales bacterium]|nr:NYN domain-containing protein [Anaerolineales bacterium]MCX7756339.1 NYN domain-containing protein [Anaerolineales bacterium]MDW8276673.1 NYN domain-containing protein [Anaerolineales bacterium]